MTSSSLPAPTARLLGKIRARGRGRPAGGELQGRALQQLLLFSVFFVALPHVYHLDASIFLCFSTLLVWRYLAGLRPTLQPGRLLLFLRERLGANED